MKQIYIVIRGGVLQFVSSDSPEVIKNVGVTLIDMDDKGDSETPPETLAIAEAQVRIW